MRGKFTLGADAQRDQAEWGIMGWLSRPMHTGAAQLVVIEVTLEPGFGHNFHKHPQQEEVIYVIEGVIEQWIEEKNQLLRAGDSAFIGADVVHASFNVSSQPARLLAILGPAVGDEGYQLVDVAAELPWRTLR